jgi:hypothetical protein
VHFGDKVFKQRKGIPMGINPGVFFANYYLYDCELEFVTQLVALVRSHPPTSGLFPTAAIPALSCASPVEVQTTHRALIGDAALLVLIQFRFVRRFVDDLVSGPNRVIHLLMYHRQTLLGGLIKGIYPNHLSLKVASPASVAPVPLHIVNTQVQAPTECHALDTTIVSRLHKLQYRDGSLQDIVQSHTTLYDKRREPCYAGLPLNRFTHVSSNIRASTSYAVLASQLHRCMVACQLLGDFAVAAGTVIWELEHTAQYNRKRLWHKAQQFIYLTAAHHYGETNPLYVLAVTDDAWQRQRAECLSHVCTLPVAHAPPNRSRFYSLDRPSMRALVTTMYHRMPRSAEGW